MRREYFEDYERAARIVAGEIDGLASYLDDDMEAAMMSYEMRDGAALMLAYVSGLDVSHARKLLGCFEKWAELDRLDHAA